MVHSGVPTVRYGDFEWDSTKAATNVRKHGITFEEAATVFLDDLAVPYTDPVNPERLILIGMSLRSNFLLVVFAERCGGEVIPSLSDLGASSDPTGSGP
jgi:uncharacterized DUF497 family protein